MTFLQVALLLLTVYTVLGYFYNLYLHPLRRFPGPRTHRASRLPWVYHSLLGDLHRHLLQLQQQYGVNVRIAPNELMCSGGTVWKDMYAAGRGKEEILPTHHLLFPSRLDTPHFIVDPDAARRGRIRSALIPSFSERSIRQYEPTIKHYLDLFLQRVQGRGEGGNSPVNMRDWYNYFAFDVLGQLAFSADFQCLERSEIHPWINSMISDTLFGPVFMSALVNLGFQRVVDMLYKQLGARFRKLRESARLKVHERLALRKPQDDFTEVLLRKLGKDAGTEAILMTGPTLIFAGSETRATLLYGLTYLLIKNSAAREKFTREVRGAFAKQEDINYIDVSHLKYLVACINEGLRYFPPVANASTRRSPAGGCIVDGAFVPPGTIMGIYHYAMYHNPAYFKNPDEFHPERWLGDPEYVDDRTELFQPFAIGPRDCLGKMLAHAEIRMMVATMILNFDMELTKDYPDLLSGMKAYGVFWSKPDLDVLLKPART